jgi:signal transduction histidine kinase
MAGVILVMRIFRARIQRKLILAFLVALIIPTSIITIYLLKASSDSLVQAAQRYELTEMGLKARAVQKLLETAKSHTLFLSQSPPIMNFGETMSDSAALSPFLAGFLKNSGDLYQNIQILDQKGQATFRIDAANSPNGEPILRSGVDLENHAGAAWFNEARKLKPGQVYISDLALDTTGGKIIEPYIPVLYYATPLSARADGLGGILVLKVSGNAIFQPLQIVNQTGEDYLIDKDGNFIAGVEPAKLYGGLLQKDASFFKAAPTDSKLIRSKAEGSLFNTGEKPGVLQTFVHIRPVELGSIDWIFVEQLPAAKILGELNNAPVVILFVAVASLVIAIGTSMFINYSMVRPMMHVSAAMEAVGNGQRDVMLPYNNRLDEIGTLSRTFEKMTSDLATAYNQLQIRTRDLEAANKVAREANRLKSEFLSTMSHELRTPLNSIVGFTDILLTGKPGALTPTQQMFLERVAGNNKRLLKLINDILDLSRIEAGRMEIVPITYNPREMLERVAAQSSALFANKNLKFEVKLGDNMPSSVVGDRDRVEQVVVNLLSNAAKFTKEGSVELNAARTKNNTWIIEVKDTGIGIAPHALEMIFEPFRQVDGSTSRQHGGSGLGLAIVRELCQMMNGQLQVQSELGKGSTFTVTLPVAGQTDTVGTNSTTKAVAA